MTSRNAANTALRDVARALFRHRRKSVLFFVVVMVGVVLITLLTPREYRSEGKLFIRLGRENAMLDSTATLGQTPIAAVPQSRENEINSVVEILQSRALLEKVVDSLGPTAILDSSVTAESVPGENGRGAIQHEGDQIGQAGALGQALLGSLSSTDGLDDREQAILRLTKKLNVEAAKKSNVIDIIYEGATPRQCQHVVAALIDSYLDEHVRLNRTRGSHEFFADQTRRLRDELSQKEAELRDLKTKTGLASPGAQRQLLVARIGRLEDELLNVESQRDVAAAKVAALREKLESLPETQVANETSGFTDEGTDRMRDQFYALQVREKEAQAKYTEDHPKMRQIRDQVTASRTVLDQEERNRKQVTKEPGRLYQQAEAAMLGEEPALAALTAHAERLTTQLVAVRGDLAVLNENEMRVAALQRDVDLLEADYRKYSNSLEQARIDQQLEAQRMSNVGIVQPASFEPRPIRPRKLLNLLLGLCVGTLGGLGLPLVLDRFDNSRQTPEGSERNLDMPASAPIPRWKSKELAIHGNK